MRWHICATFRAKVATSLPSEKEELACKNTRSVATTLYVPIRVSVPDNPPAFHARCSYSLLKSVDFRRHLPTFGLLLPSSAEVCRLPVD